MKSGMTLQSLAKTLDRQSTAKEDFLVDTRELTMLSSATEDGPTLSELNLPEGGGEYRVLPIAHQQIATRLKIPVAYYNRIREGFPTLLDQNVNTLFRGTPERRMVRAFNWGDGNREARAFLSDRYRRLDCEELLGAALPILGEIPDVQIPSCNLSEKFMYLRAVAPKITGEVRKGDVVQAGVQIRNSEVGWGALEVSPIVYRLVCTNGMVVAESVRKYHIGRQIDSEDALKVLSDETIQKDDEAFFSKLADVVRAAVDETRFQAIIAQMREAADSQKMAKPIESMERLSQKYGLGEGEKDGILGHLIEGGDLTAYGALNAVTRFAQDVDSYDRSVELEEVGGKILEMAPTKEWERIAVAA